MTQKPLPKCNYCKKYGHIIKFCPSIRQQMNNSNSSLKNNGNSKKPFCTICKKPGHWPSKCRYNKNNNNNNNNSNIKKPYCKICKKPGHSTIKCHYNNNNKNNNKNGFFKWQWHDDENNSFKDYDKETSIKINSLKVNTSFTTTIKNYSYKITRTTISSGIQLNIKTNKSRIIKSVRVNSKNNKYMNSNNKSNSALPKWWTKQKLDSNQRYILVPENKTNKYIIDKAKEFYSKTMTNISKLKNIWIVQNLSMWHNHKYIEENWRKSKRVNKINVNYLFHGSSMNIIKDEICTNGFNRNFNTAYAYGKGDYFARDASYSMGGYSKYEKSTNSYFLLYCRVLCGESCKGNSNMLGPDNKTNGYKYETMVNNVSSPSIYVTTMDKQAYPLILFEISA